MLRGREELISALQDWQGAGISAGSRKASWGRHRKHLDGYTCIFAFVETYAIKFSRRILESDMLSSVEFEGILCCSFLIWNWILETTFCSWRTGNHNIKKVCPKSKQEITPGKIPFFPAPEVKQEVITFKLWSYIYFSIILPSCSGLDSLQFRHFFQTSEW